MARSALRRRAAAAGPWRGRGFTLIELLIVVSLIAIASAVATLALRDPSATQLEREAARLAALLETARAEARAAGVRVQWVPDAESRSFRFMGLPDSLGLPSGWLDDATRAEVRLPAGLTRAAILGPEPVIGAQRIVLRLADQQLTLATDGLGPFAVVAEDGVGDAPR